MIDTGPERASKDFPERHTHAKLAIEEVAERRELVHRVLRSSTFVRSERLGAFLKYICDMSLKGREAELNEQRIGSAVFGRSQDYDSAVDGIVRSQASRLRQRLELYFQHEGADEVLRITIPRGRYVPVFERPKTQMVNQPAPLEPSSLVTTSSIATPEAINGNSQRSWFPWGLSFLLALTLVAVVLRDHRKAPVHEETLQTHPLWSRLFSKSQRTIVVAPDSGLVMYHGISGHEVDLKQYLDAGYRSELNDQPPVSTAATMKEWLLDLSNRRYTSMVDVNAILCLKDKARALGDEVDVRYARDLRPNDIKSGTTILLGMSSANPWVELFERDMNFVLQDDFKTNFSVLNRHPQNDEPALWQALRSDPQRRVFGVVALVPNLTHDGDTLLIEGISMSGTEAALDFVSDDAQLLPFLIKIRQSDGTLPHFEVLLESQNMGASAVHSKILAWRSIK